MPVENAMSISPKQTNDGENLSGSTPGGGGEVFVGGQSGKSVVSTLSGEDNDISYLGRYEHGADEKKRVQIPAKWRPSDTENYELTAMIWTRTSEAESCLLVFPPTEMKKFLKSVKQLSWGDPQAETLRRALGGGAEPLKFDKVGRVCIPDRIAKTVGIEKNSEVMLVGLMDVFQIWNLDRFKAVRSMDGISLPQALGQLKPSEIK